MHNRIAYLKLGLLLAAALAVAAVALVYGHSRGGFLRLPIPLANETGRAVMALAKVHQTATKAGRVQWELNAESAELEANSGQMLLRSPAIDFFLDDGSKVHLTAREGTLDTRNNDIALQGNVRVQNGRYTLLSETLAYSDQQHILRSDTPVSIAGADIELRASTMIYDLNRDEGHFNGHVEGHVLADLGR